ncbi:MAG: hypothetical protein FJW77_09370 [Actinobacteria bacterium]|nr:hypothetical protein [Actinomycetota bacterium]
MSEQDLIDRAQTAVGDHDRIVTTEDHHRVPGAALFALALDEVEVSVHRRLTVRTFEVIHPAGAEKWEFEADYLGSHLKFVLAAIDGDA